MTPNPRAAAVAGGAAATIVGLFLAATGPLRSFVGDIVVVVFLVACVASTGLGTTRTRVAGVCAFAFAVEAFQGLHLVAPRGHWLTDLTVGSTADPWDLLAYVLGAGAAYVAERWYTS